MSALKCGGHGRNAEAGGTRKESLGDREVGFTSETELIVELSDTIEVIRSQIDDELRQILDLIYDQDHREIESFQQQELADKLGISRLP